MVCMQSEVVAKKIWSEMLDEGYTMQTSDIQYKDTQYTLQGIKFQARFMELITNYLQSGQVFIECIPQDDHIIPVDKEVCPL